MERMNYEKKKEELLADIEYQAKIERLIASCLQEKRAKRNSKIYYEVMEAVFNDICEYGEKDGSNPLYSAVVFKRDENVYYLNPRINGTYEFRGELSPTIKNIINHYFDCNKFEFSLSELIRLCLENNLNIDLRVNEDNINVNGYNLVVEKSRSHVKTKNA